MWYIAICQDLPNTGAVWHAQRPILLWLGWGTALQSRIRRDKTHPTWSSDRLQTLFSVRSPTGSCSIKDHARSASSGQTVLCSGWVADPDRALQSLNAT